MESLESALHCGYTQYHDCTGIFDLIGSFVSVLGNYEGYLEEEGQAIKVANLIRKIQGRDSGTAVCKVQFYEGGCRCCRFSLRKSHQ